MEISQDFKWLLSNFDKVDERVFLVNIRDFAQENKETAIKIYAALLKEKNMNVQLKYLLLKSMGELKYREFIPLLQQLLEDEDNNMQILYTAIESLVRINSIEAYKTVVSFLRENPIPDLNIPIEESLNSLFSKNRLLYHFDVFYRHSQKEPIHNVEKSLEYLVKYLPDIYVKDILPALSSKFDVIRYEALNILKYRPNALYYIPIYNYFKSRANSVNEKFFLLLVEALVVNASLSKLSHKIFSSLKEQLNGLTGIKRQIFAVMLLKLNTPEMIAEIEEIYLQLDYNGKRQVLENLTGENYLCYLDFIRSLLIEENNDDLQVKIMEILIDARDFDYIFQVIRKERMRRKEILLEILFKFSPPNLQNYVKELVHTSQEDRILFLSLEYLLHHAADDYFDIIQSIFFSGVPHEIKAMIMRNIGNFSAYRQKIFMESIFRDLKVIQQFKKDFLLSVLGLMNEKKLAGDFEDLLLNRILIMMEETGTDEIIDFIHFFEKYEINNKRDMTLIIDELRLLQAMILKSGHQDELVRKIHSLIKDIEKRTLLKKSPQHNSMGTRGRVTT